MRAPHLGRRAREEGNCERRMRGQRDKSYEDDGVALEVVGRVGRGEGESKLDGKLTAIFAGDAIGRVHRKPRRKIGDKISFL
ncbi:MAG: hypothetical protein ABIS18_06635, partial [Actinomycetota bacterium]